MEVYYTPPILVLREDPIARAEASSFRGSQNIIPGVHGSRSMPVHASTPGSAHASTSGSSQGSSPKDYDENVLIDVERNIASLEQSIRNKEIAIEMEYLEESRANKLKLAGKRLLK